MYDGNTYEYIDISKHPEPTDTTLLAAKVRWFRWLKTDQGTLYKELLNEPIC